MQQPIDVHPAIGLDDTVTRTNESATHWAIKSAIIHRFRTDPGYSGVVEAEKKTSDLIADIRCEFEEAPSGTPRDCVIEVQTSASQKNLIRAVEEHLRHGYAVYWVFDGDALQDRKKAEKTLAEQMTSIPSFGVAALAEGELTLGSPITFEEFESRPPWLGGNELYVPTYDRSARWYNHWEFLIDGDRVMVYRVAGESEFFVSQKYEGGQQTLPQRASWEWRDFHRAIEAGEIRRASPVRGPP